MVINSSSDAHVHWYGQEDSPLVVILHDFMGRLPWLGDYARRIADEGYRVAVPDFYAGRSSTEPDDARLLMAERLEDVPGALRQVQEVIGEGRALGSQQVALIGFSMGTRLALAYTAGHPGISAVVGYYGRPHDPAAQVRVPVLFQQGSNDVDEAGASDAHALQSLMVEQGFAGIEIVVYDDARHGFQNDQNPDAYAVATADEAFQRTVAFLNAKLTQQ